MMGEAFNSFGKVKGTVTLAEELLEVVGALVKHGVVLVVQATVVEHTTQIRIEDVLCDIVRARVQASLDHREILTDFDVRKRKKKKKRENERHKPIGSWMTL